jgi:acyl-CoA synthetase (AMP-forming)/AMP-acid ligase II
LAKTSYRTNTTLAGTVSYRLAYHNADKIAVVCPHEKVKWSYNELWERISAMAGGFRQLGYQQGEIVVTEAQQSTANLVVQLAASHLGMRVLTVKNAEELASLAPEFGAALKGAALPTASSFLKDAPVFLKNLIPEIKGAAVDGVTNRDLDLAFYSSKQNVPNRQLYLVGVGTAGLLEVKPEDQICIAAPLYHWFGMGTAVSAFVRNASIYIPDLSKPDLQESTLLITDKHQLDKFRKAGGSSKLRGGVVKVGSGNLVLNEKAELNGAQLWTLGDSSDYMRPLFDASVDTYYSYK